MTAHTCKHLWCFHLDRRHSRQKSQQLAVVTSSSTSGSVTSATVTSPESLGSVETAGESQTFQGGTPIEEPETPALEQMEQMERDPEDETVEKAFSYVRHRETTVTRANVD